METFVTKIVSLVLRPIMKEKEMKHRIITATHKLVMQFGVRSVSMDDIAGELGISKKTLYQYFKDKDEIVEHVVSFIIDHNEELCCQMQKKGENAVQEMFLLIDMLREMFNNMNPAVMFDLHKYHPKAYNLIAAHKEVYLFKRVKENIELGIKQKLYRKDLDVDILARYRISTMFLPFDITFQKSTHKTMMECQVQIINNFLYGMLTQKGFELAESYPLKK